MRQDVIHLSNGCLRRKLAFVHKRCSTDKNVVFMLISTMEFLQFGAGFGVKSVRAFQKIFIQMNNYIFCICFPRFCGPIFKWIGP